MVKGRMSEAVRSEIWDRLEAGESLTEASRAVGRSLTTVRSYVLRHGGRRPVPPVVWSSARLSLAEREEISRCLAVGESFRAIGRRLGRAHTTVSREVNANGGRSRYRAVRAEASVRERAKRPRPSKLVANSPLRQVVISMLTLCCSPEQISGRLARQYPDDQSMQVAPETIYRALYAGTIDIPAKKCLRSRRAIRRPRTLRRTRSGPGRIKNPVSISERPAEIEARVELGHWEGDLIVGRHQSAVASLVERVTRYTILVPLPGRRTAKALNQALIETFQTLPPRLRRSLTWDQGKEIAGHATLADTLGIGVYLCDPHSPWQRGTNENTNGLLRQWLPRTVDLYQLDPNHITNIANTLNHRPRRVLDWRTPTEALTTTNPTP